MERAHLSRSGADLKDIQRLLGHASVKTTEIYVQSDDRCAVQAQQLLPPEAAAQSEAQGMQEEPGASRRVAELGRATATAGE